MKSFHDYHLVGYEVDGQRGEVRLNLAWLYAGVEPRPPEQVVFRGVEDYFFEHDLGVNIVFDIEEFPLLGFLQGWEEHFRANKQWGWPRFWKGDVSSTAEALSSRGSKCYELTTSYGLSGWVVAASVDSHVRESP